MATTTGGLETPVRLRPDLPKAASESASIIQKQKPGLLGSSPNSVTPPTLTSASAVAYSKPPTTPVAGSRLREIPSVPEADVIHIPSYSRWFSWNNIHECERRILPEFFDGRSPSKTPKVYIYIRNAIVKKFRDSIKQKPPSKENPMPKLTFTDARRSIVADVGSVRKVFDFLEAWGLINYYGSPLTKAQLKWEDKESKAVSTSSQQSSEPGGAGASSPADASAPKKKFCSNCNSLCTIACFSNIKKDTTLCARCYVRAGVNSTDFKRVEISEDVKTDWSEKETLHLLEAVMHFGDDWKKVSEHVVGRSEKECVNRFIKLPFGERFIGPPDSSEAEESFHKANDELDTEYAPSKRLRLSPLSDTSNPIMAQAAFLSALVGVDVAEAAASAAVKALPEVNDKSSNKIHGSSASVAIDQESFETANGKTTRTSSEGVYLEAKSQLEKEEQDLEKKISEIAEVQAKEIHEKLVHFEELELQMEKEKHHVWQMQNLLFADQLTLMFHKNDGTKRKESLEAAKLKIES